MNKVTAEAIRSENTPIFHGLCIERGFPVMGAPEAPLKRQRQKAGRLTQKVWRAIQADPMADTSTLTVTTQELPQVSG